MASTVPCAPRPCHTFAVLPPQPSADAQEAGAEALHHLRRAADLYPEMRGELAAHARSVAAILRLGG